MAFPKRAFLRPFSSSLAPALALLGAFPVGAGASAPAQAGEASSAPAEASAASAEKAWGPTAWLAEWRAERGPTWRLETHPLTGRLELLYGGRAAADAPPDTGDPEAWFTLARDWIARTRAMHGVAADELTNAAFRYLPLAQGNTTDKIVVRFEQSVADVPVEQAALHVLFDTSGALLSVQSSAAAEVESPGAAPAFEAGFAALLAADQFKRDHGVEPTRIELARLLHAIDDAGEERAWRLAWQCDVAAEGPGVLLGRRYTIDARTRVLLRSESTVHAFDVLGTVRGNATPGLTTDRAANPPTLQPMPRVTVASSAGTVETDSDGNFRIAGVNTPVDLTLSFAGTYTDVANTAGANHQVTVTGIQPNQPVNLVLNPSPTEFVTAQANAQLHVNRVHDWIESRFPTDTTHVFLAPINCNVNDPCNAAYTGVSLNFSRASGSCNNSSFSTVVAHELGHWLNDLYGTGNGPDGMGEGNADIFAMYCYDDPQIGRFLNVTGGFSRTGNNTRQFCGDTNPGCHAGGSLHANGEVWMGAAWKVRTNLGTSLGAVQGDLVADLLFLGWLNAYDQREIRSIIEAQWLTLDDDDGNIENGTPNYAAIDAGFRAQGFPGFDLRPISIRDVSRVENTTDLLGPYPVICRVDANQANTITAVRLEYTVNDGATQILAMQSLGPKRYGVTIPGTGGPSIVRYWIVAEDDLGNVRTAPEAGASAPWIFTVGTRFDLVVSDFEADGGGFTSGFPGDTATLGQWVHGDPIGTAAQPETGNGGSVNCWFTGQGSPGGSVGEADVDGGRTTLVSPVFDAAGAPVLELSYARWYHNMIGAGAGEDIFTVDASRDGGATWVRVETVGPTGPGTSGGWIERTIDLARILSPTANMRVRFVASDFGVGSIVEAAIDDVAIVAIGDTALPPQRYCQTTINSTGAPATLFVSGSQSLTQNNFTVSASGVPGGSFGLFFFGDLPVDLPLLGGVGRLCVAGSIQRFPIVQADPTGGFAFYNVDFTDTSTAGPIIQPGTTWGFQLWFRDFVGGSSSSNTTDAILVNFVD